MKSFEGFWKVSRDFEKFLGILKSFKWFGEVSSDLEKFRVISIYKKSMHTDQYLLFDSNHHIGQKLGVVSTLKHRIETIVTTQEDKN